ncbi:MAG: hypothetical protein HUU15_03890 [Candidatus Brocadiae bacterium]|nr:hypothetical protein [Candidatus Brocadiia bacterium]
MDLDVRRLGDLLKLARRGILLAAALCAAAAEGRAEEPAAAPPAERKESGFVPRVDFRIEAALSAVYRSEGVTRILDRDSERDSEGYLAPEAGVQLVAWLPRSASLTLEIRNAPLRANLFDHDTWGTEANRDVPGGGRDYDAFLRRAFVRVDDLFWEQLSVKIGVQDFALSLRRPGDAFFADLLHSEFALVAPVTEAAAGGSTYALTAPGGTDPATHGLFRDEATPAGARLTWNAFHMSLLFVDAFYFTVLEGGADHADERFFGLNADLLVPFTEEAPSLVTLVLAGIENDRTGSRIWTVGLGVDLVPGVPEGLDVFAELYWQSGFYGEPAGRRVRQSAWAGRAGARVPFASLPLRPAVEISGCCLTGDRGAPGDDVNRDFVSYEGIDDALVVESDLHGLDIDSNYLAGRARITAEADVIQKADLRFEVMYAYFRLYREPERAGGAADRNPGRRLGHEVDLRVAFDFNEHATLSLFAGALLDSAWLAHRDGFDTGKRHALVGGLSFRVTF